MAKSCEFNFGEDSVAAAHDSVGLFLGFSTSIWPLPDLLGWTRFERIVSAAILFMIVLYLTHLNRLHWATASRGCAVLYLGARNPHPQQICSGHNPDFAV